MRKLTVTLVLFLLPLIGMAQEYQTFIYTSENLSKEIEAYSNKLEEMNRDRYLKKLFDAGKESVKGIAAGYVSSFIDMGVNAIGSLVTRNSRLKEEWEETVRAENSFQTHINTVSSMSDFYKESSERGALDPKGMCFDGIGCLRKEGNDTVFYISCHIDRSKIDRIFNHSKFELVLDTLIISPIHSNLPNSMLDIPFSFEERDNFVFSMNMKITSSWINEIVQLQKNQELGEFSINIPVDQKVLDKNGFLRYVRKKDEKPAYKIIGESFIVPRSYMGYENQEGELQNLWGTGEYKLSIQIKETCSITSKYRENWKEDRKRRKAMQPKENFLANSWQSISNQRWDELSKSWIITTLKAPADIITRDVIDKLGLEAER